MSLKKNLVCGVALLALLGGSGVQAFAVEYPSETEAETEAKITFTKDEGPTEPVDPENPLEPITPELPTNPNGAELMIVYVSPFEFGSQDKSGTTWQAKFDKMDNGDKKTPFIATKDARGTDREGWSLTASLSKPFTDDKANELKGAELSLSNMFYSDTVQGAPTANAGKVVLAEAPKEIASADATNGSGVWSLGLGKLTGDTTDGVTLTVPKSTVKNEATYTAEVTWELTADPAK